MTAQRKSNIPADFPSPRDLLKARRPEQFSDSKLHSSNRLNRTILDYQLETLTNRSQETEFERFARAMAKKAICPNLRGQTGPAGGGDSKVDSETFPVDGQLALGWTTAEPSNAASERWAFALSTKADWSTKVKSDLRKISTTCRGYTKVFFISSRYIPDRPRSENEDRLSAELGFEVKILDRTWLLDQVFDLRLAAIAIETLGIDIPSEEQAIEGIQDREKRELLEEIDHQIQESLQASAINMQLV